MRPIPDAGAFTHNRRGVSLPHLRDTRTRIPHWSPLASTLLMEGHIPNDADPIRIAQDLTTADRRESARYRLRAQLWVHDRARSKRLGEALDIGLGGLRVQTNDPIPPARRFALSIEIVVDGIERPRIEAIARCAWHRATPKRQFEAGFEFVEMTPKMRQRIAQFIDEFGL